MSRKNRVLCLVQLPPPMHGVANINQMLINSQMLNEAYELDVLPVAYNRNLRDMHRQGLGKLFKFLKYSFCLLGALVFRRPVLVYFTLSPLGAAF